jgi:protease-4
MAAMRRRTVFVLAACVAAVAIGAALAGGFALLLRHNKGAGGEKLSWSASDEYLDVHLNGEIPEQPPTSLPTLFERHPTSLRTIVQSLERAGNDPKVKAVVVRIDSLPVGWGRVDELRDAIARFRRSGKPAYAYMESCGNKEYYLAAACSKIFVVPTAMLDVTGLEAEVMFFRGTLDKLGVEAQFEGIGKYKNAPNQFTQSGFTEPHREQMEALVGSFYGEYVGAIAKARGKTVEQVRHMLDSGPYVATEARRLGLVDDLVYQDELSDKVGHAARITPGRYVRSSWRDTFRSRPKIAVVYVVGEITSGESQRGSFGGEGTAGSDTVAAAIRDAREDDDVKAIILRVDSPGGSGIASDVMWREVKLAKQEKPVIASMGDVAASGGYYVSMGSVAIVAQPNTITGSIGVFSGKFSMRGLYDKVGVTEEIVTRGKNADLFTSYRPWTADERAKVRGLAEAFYNEFVTKAAQGRGRTFEQVHAVAQGRVWTGRDALAVGLVDRIGGLRDAIEIAKEKAKIDKQQDVELVVLPERKGLFETLFEEDDTMFESRLPASIRPLIRWARSVQDGAILSARLPFDLKIH